MFKPAQSKPSSPNSSGTGLTRQLDCWQCGIILVVEVPPRESGYPCVCGAQIDIVVSKAA